MSVEVQIEPTSTKAIIAYVLVAVVAVAVVVSLSVTSLQPYAKQVAEMLLKALAAVLS